MTKKKSLMLDVSQFRKSSDPEQFDFDTTENLPTFLEFVGQERALKAANFGIDIKREGFNIFALGPPGLGKRSIIRAVLEKAVLKSPAPKDICYINNFENSREPLVLLLEKGVGSRLAADMLQLIEILRSSIPAIFESKEYTTRIKEIQEESRQKQEQSLENLEREAKESALTILRTAQGFMLAALKPSGEIISEEEFNALPDEEKQKKEALMKALHDHLTEYLETLALWQKEQRQKIKEALKYFTMLQVGAAFDDVKNRYKNNPSVMFFLNRVQQAILDNPNDFRKRNESASGLLGNLDEFAFNRYKVNVIVDHANASGPPIIVEDNPTFSNLVGRIEQISQLGALITDFTLIRAGALHKANGGYLLLDAHKILAHPYAWEGLKRALRAKEVRVEYIHQALGFMGTASLDPQPMPLDIKVVLFGERMVYYLLCSLDPDFLDLFKVAADFDEDIQRNEENNALFARLLSNLAKKDNLKPLTKAAVAAVIDHAARINEDAEKISTHVRRLSDLLREADHWANKEEREVIDRDDIQRAIAEQRYRASRIKDEKYENFERGAHLINTEGSAIGQINALSYVELGGFAFGFPTRITARASAGRGDVIDIEREVKLGGPIHTKGVLILRGYLSGLFVKEPWSLSASLGFEQSYGGVEGDSASAAEAIALLSAIGDIPLKQNIAITGSLNQLGQMQAIGGVNEKIEGFFDICRMRGLSGDQGVIIPFSNVDRLMLNDDVVNAGRDGKFHIYTVKTIDEALTIITGLDAGVRDKNGNFPADSVYGIVEARLIQFAKTHKKNAKPGSKKT